MERNGRERETEGDGREWHTRAEERAATRRGLGVGRPRLSAIKIAVLTKDREKRREEKRREEKRREEKRSDEKRKNGNDGGVWSGSEGEEGGRRKGVRGSE